MSDPLHHRLEHPERRRCSPDAGDAEPWDANWLDERASSSPRFWRVMVMLAFSGLVLLLLGWSLSMLLGSGHDASAVR